MHNEQLKYLVIIVVVVTIADNVDGVSYHATIVVLLERCAMIEREYYKNDGFDYHNIMAVLSTVGVLVVEIHLYTAAERPIHHHILSHHQAINLTLFPFIVYAL